MSVAEIVVERDTANDESATIVAIYVPSGTQVEQDDLIFDVENSKATEEVRAPRSGVLAHDLHVGQSVDFGKPIARIVPYDEWNAGTSTQHSPETLPAPVVPPPAEPAHVTFGAADDIKVAPGLRLTRPLISHAAANLLAQHGLTAMQFDTDFITTHDVLSLLGRKPTEQAAPPKPSSSVNKQKPGHAISRSKKVEIETLSGGAGATMLSVLGLTLGALTIRRKAEDFLNDRITDLVIFEAARLMRKYPRLNSYYDDGYIYSHDAVHAGLAIDGGQRLVVYGIQNADQVNLADLSGIISDAVTRYACNELTGAELSRATFTVTDLSADDLDFVFPLLPRGQSCILGISRSAKTGYRLFVGFDHRVSEGREVAQFLTELRERLQSFNCPNSGTADVPCCAYCMRSSAEAATKSRDKGLLKIVDRHGQDILCCASCWNGW
jgi:pyruvate/2-oxoglutarate dehydrogenase complex dihydrolipoamide acyltransferase (E2) component